MLRLDINTASTAWIAWDQAGVQGFTLAACATKPCSWVFTRGDLIVYLFSSIYISTYPYKVEMPTKDIDSKGQVRGLVHRAFSQCQMTWEASVRLLHKIARKTEPWKEAKHVTVLEDSIGKLRTPKKVPLSSLSYYLMFRTCPILHGS